jgi:hypothetical protein
LNPALRKIILAAAAAAVLAAGLWYFHYIPDDAYIGLRYARNAAAGRGLVFNTGERVEGYTNFLWIVILAAAAKAGMPLAGGARIIGLVFAAATLVLAYLACRRADTGDGGSGRKGGWPIAAPIILASSVPFAAWALSGTEIPLFTFLLTAGMLLLSSGRSSRAVLSVFTLLVLVRPEGAAYLVLAAILLAVRGERIGKIAAEGAAVAALLLAPYLVWKFYYFGQLLPNTFYAKTGPPAVQIRNGLSYTGRFAAMHAWLPAAALLLQRFGARGGGDETAGPESVSCGPVSRRFASVTVPLSIIALNWLIVTLLGGDWMVYYRLLVPGIPSLAVMASSSIPRSSISRGAALIVIFSCIAMSPGASGYKHFKRERQVVRAFGLAGEVLRERLPEGTVLGCGSTGAIGYYSGLPIVDILGLTEPEIARRGKIVSDQPGHMKALGSHVLDREPDLLLLGNIQIHRGRRAENLERIKIQERDIILDPRFSSSYEFINLPLEGGFFLSCYRRSGSTVFSE